MDLFVAIVIFEVFSLAVLAEPPLSADTATREEGSADLEASDTQITSIILPHGPGGTHHVILPQSYAKGADQSIARYADDGGYTTQTFVLRDTIPPPLRATTYGPPQPVVFSNFRARQPFYNHRFGSPKFGFQPKEIFKPANQELTENVKYTEEPQGKTGPQLFHSEETYAPDSYPPRAYTPAETYGLPEEEPQREHDIPSVRVNVDHSNKASVPFPGNKFYQDPFFDIKPKHAGGYIKHSDEPEENDESHSGEDTSSRNEDYLSHYVKYAPREQNYIPPSHSIIKPYLPQAKGITKSYVNPGYVRGHYVQKFDQSYLEPNPPQPHLQPYYKRPLPIHQTQLPPKTHYDESYPTNHYPYEPEYIGHYSESSDWTPINAPRGAVPAKSFDIPSPDLSNGHPDKLFRRGVDDYSIVLGKTKQLGKIKQKIQGNSEGVVSAVVRVKQ